MSRCEMQTARGEAQEARSEVREVSYEARVGQNGCTVQSTHLGGRLPGDGTVPESLAHTSGSTG